MANTGVKSKTIVHEIVMMLFFFPSFVVIRTTGPDSINVKALLIFNLFTQAPLYIRFRLTSASAAAACSAGGVTATAVGCIRS
jgi:hypothetical protein